MSVLADPTFYASATALVTAISGIIYNNSQINGVNENIESLKQKFGTLVIAVDGLQNNKQAIDQVGNLISELQNILQKHEQEFKKVNSSVQHLGEQVIMQNKLIESLVNSNIKMTEYLNTQHKANLQPLKINLARSNRNDNVFENDNSYRTPVKSSKPKGVSFANTRSVSDRDIRNSHSSKNNMRNSRSNFNDESTNDEEDLMA